MIGQLIAEASIEGTEEYSRDVYDEYVERRKCLIDGVNKIPGCYTPVPMGRFILLHSCLWMILRSSAFGA